MVSTIVAVLGTLAGVVLTALLQQRATRSDRAAARQEAHRTAALDAVVALGAALADHRRAMWVREEARLNLDLLSGDQTTARAASHATRSAITAPLMRVGILLPALAAPAQAAADATYAMRDAVDIASLGAARQRALEAADTLMTAAQTALEV